MHFQFPVDSDWNQKADKPVYTYFWTWTYRPNGILWESPPCVGDSFAFNRSLYEGPPWPNEDRKIADTTSSSWVSFVARGNPNGSGLSAWPAFNASSLTVMEAADDHFGLPLKLGLNGRTARAANFR